MRRVCLASSPSTLTVFLGIIVTSAIIGVIPLAINVSFTAEKSSGEDIITKTSPSFLRSSAPASMLSSISLSSL